MPRSQRPSTERSREPDRRGQRGGPTDHRRSPENDKKQSKTAARLVSTNRQKCFTPAGDPPKTIKTKNRKRPPGSFLLAVRNVCLQRGSVFYSIFICFLLQAFTMFLRLPPRPCKTQENVTHCKTILNHCNITQTKLKHIEETNQQH